MTRSFRYALTAALGALLVVPAFAQDNFPDVPESHWAYKELARMKQEGLLVGYPDGLFRGARPASRYELAVACHAVWANLKGITDGLKAQIDDLTNKMANAPTKADLDALKAQIDALQAEINKINNEDIPALRRMMDEFRAELTRMGADVDAMKKDLDSLKGDVAWLKQHALPFDVSGDANFWMGGGYATPSSTVIFGVTVDGRPTGVSRRNGGGPNAGVMSDLTILHEGALKLASNNSSGPTWHATMVYGNMLDENANAALGSNNSHPFDDKAYTHPGLPFGEGTESFYFDDFAVDFNTSVMGLGMDAELGRFGYKVSPYVFQRPDNTPYFSNSRWDDGMWRIDGANLGFKFGGAKLNLVGGRLGSQTDTWGEQLWPVFVGAAGYPFLQWRPTGHNRNQSGAGMQPGLFQADTVWGANLSVPLSNTGSVDLSYMRFNAYNGVLATNVNPSTTATGNADGAQVYGADLKFNFSMLDVQAGYTKADVMAGNHSVISRDNQAWYGQVGYSGGNWGITGGYRRIETQFGAPGDWGRIGIWWNPTDIQGWYANAHFDLSKDLRLMVNGGLYSGTGETNPTGSGVGLATNDHLNHVSVGLGYKMGGNHNLLLGYEGVFWDLKSPGITIPSGGAPYRPTETWWNLGWGWDLSARSSFSVLWQFSDYKGKIAPFGPFVGGAGMDAKGGFITSQLTVRF